MKYINKVYIKKYKMPILRIAFKMCVKTPTLKKPHKIFRDDIIYINIWRISFNLLQSFIMFIEDNIKFEVVRN